MNFIREENYIEEANRGFFLSRRKEKDFMKTKKELVESVDTISLEIVGKSKGHTGTDFCVTMDCDYLYGFLTGEIQITE